jgi:hypothetical protein
MSFLRNCFVSTKSQFCVFQSQISSQPYNMGAIKKYFSKGSFHYYISGYSLLLPLPSCSIQEKIAKN